MQKYHNAITIISRKTKKIIDSTNIVHGDSLGAIRYVHTCLLLYDVPVYTRS